MCDLEVPDISHYSKDQKGRKGRTDSDILPVMGIIDINFSCLLWYLPHI